MWQRPSFTLIVSGIFCAYIIHSMWTIYQLYNPPSCVRGQTCLNPAWKKTTKHQLMFCTSSKSSINRLQDLTPIWISKGFNLMEPTEIKIDVSLPTQTLRNGTLFIHAFLHQSDKEIKSLPDIIGHHLTSYGGCALTKYHIEQVSAFQLLSGNKKKEKSGKKISRNNPITHWKPRLTLYVVSEPLALVQKNVPAEIAPFLKLNNKREYLPVIYISELSYRIKDLIPLNSSLSKIPLTIQYSPISVGRLRLMVTVEQAMKNMQIIGLTEKDTDEITGIFFDTNIYLLFITCIVSAFHIIFDFLAFKNDISFWRNRTSMVGVSFRTLIWRCVSQTIVTFYLLDENTSLIVLVPCFLAAIIEVWKVTKALKMKITFNGLMPKIELGSSTEEEKLTEGYDSESMRYLSYLLYPLVIGGAVYSLFYTAHKSWYSWCIKSLANGVYAFGFLFMLPQLFVNYRLKSVAHLPWRAFTYKAFNTFIDDLFAFIITMPTAHRVACFRDDIVFLVYLYQRWLYPVDKKRFNEYGNSYDQEEKKEK